MARNSEWALCPKCRGHARPGTGLAAHVRNCDGSAESKYRLESKNGYADRPRTPRKKSRIEEPELTSAEENEINTEQFNELTVRLNTLTVQVSALTDLVKKQAPAARRDEMVISFCQTIQAMMEEGHSCVTGRVPGA